jgi:phosphoheptose isomerase
MNDFFPDNPDYTMDNFISIYADRLNQSLKTLDLQKVEQTFEAISKGIKSKATIYTCGNGGSSSIAEHLVCDFVKGASSDSTIDPKVVPLLSTPTVTAIANDKSYQEIFSYQIKKLGKEGDILLSVSSSGNSENIIEAINTAKLKGLLTISFVGFDGGVAKEISDFSIHVNSNNYGICEDAHHALMHIFAQFLRLKNIDDPDKVGNLKF